ncbi:hypothetical protein Tco_0320589 [Tanacetum coccineum]
MAPRIVLTRSRPISLNAARPVNTIQPRTAVNNAGPMKNIINNAYSTARRPFNKIIAANNSNFNKRVNIVNDKNVNAARLNAIVNTARPKAVLSVVKGIKGNTGNPQQDLKDKGVIDSRCSRHMTGNRSYLTDYEEIDGGFVAFGDDFVEINKSVSKSVVEKPTDESNEPKIARKENEAPIIDDWVSESEDEDVPKIKTVEMFNKSSLAKINFVKSIKQVKSLRNTSVDKNRQNTLSPRGNKIN